MAVMLTSSPRQTLLLRLPRWSAIPAAVLLAVALHPVVNFLQTVVERLYPLAPRPKRSWQESTGSWPRRPCGKCSCC